VEVVTSSQAEVTVDKVVADMAANLAEEVRLTSYHALIFIKI
jgi:hypothetical protein